MKKLQPITELDEETKRKAVAAIRHLELQLVEPMTRFLWNDLFLRDDDGSYYATFHDYIDLKPNWFYKAGLFRISLYRYGEDVVATSDAHNDCGYDIWFVTSRNLLEVHVLAQVAEPQAVSA